MRRNYKHPGNREEINAMEAFVRHWSRCFTSDKVILTRIAVAGKKGAFDHLAVAQ